MWPFTQHPWLSSLTIPMNKNHTVARAKFRDNEKRKSINNILPTNFCNIVNQYAVLIELEVILGFHYWPPQS